MGRQSDSDAEFEAQIAKMAIGLKEALDGPLSGATAADDDAEFNKQFERENQLADLQAKRDQIEADRRDRELRIEYSRKFFRLGISWLVTVVLVIFSQGVGSRFGWFWLSDKVIIALLAATSTIFGLLTVWAAWLFPSTDKLSKSLRRTSSKK